MKKNKAAIVEYDYLHMPSVKIECNFQSFIRWLKLHGIYSNYRRAVEENYIDKKKYRYFSNMREWLEEICKDSYIIDSSLHWIETMEGQTFWSYYNQVYKLHNKTYSIHFKPTDSVESIEKIIHEHLVE